MIPRPDERAAVLAAPRLRARVILAGHVQGVGYRQQAVTLARSLGATGWIRNLPSGRIEVVVEGESTAVHAMLAWLKRGPRQARVDACSVAFEPDRGEFAEFTSVR